MDGYQQQTSIVSPGWEDYMRNHDIENILKSLMVALVHHRPNCHVDYMIECLDYVAENRPSDIYWNTFLNIVPRDGTCKAPGRLAPLKQTSRKDEELTEGESEQQANIGKGSADTICEQAPNHLSSRTDMKSKDSLVPSDNGRDVSSLAEMPLHTNGMSGIPALANKEASANDDNKELKDGSSHDPFVWLDEEELKLLRDQLKALGTEAENILRGDWSYLPALPSNIVRIFLSSTFSDFKAERNILPQQAFPELQAYCQERGLDFQVVDMRWGVTDELANDHQVSTLCINEIIRCQQISRGPNFVVFLGNRYGFQSFPAVIQQTHFEALVQIAAELELEHRHLLREWFKLDTNAIPPEYVLQPIIQKLPSYKESDEGASDGSGRAAWDEAQKQLRYLLRTCAGVARQRNILTQEMHDVYFVSVTEEEIMQGIMRQPGAEKHALCFVRDLTGLEDAATQPATSKYMDVDDHSQQRLKQLIAEDIIKHLPPHSRLHYQLPWLDEPLETSNKQEYLTYLKKFSQDFVTQIKRLIEQMHNNNNESNYIRENLYCIVLHHAKFAQQKVDVFYGMEDAIERIKAYLMVDSGENRDLSNNPSVQWTGDSSGKIQLPLIIAGGSGYGKTTLVAYVAQQVQTWMGRQAVVVARFFGTSPDSSKLSSVLQSVIQQIALIYQFCIPSDTEMDTMDKVRKLFWRLLEKVGESPTERKLVLIFDSVDQLEATHGVHTMVWLPKILPSNVFLIISMLSEGYVCLQHAQARILDPQQYIMMKLLSKDSAVQIVDAYLNKVNRKVTPAQKDHILLAFENCAKPLFLKLMMDRAKTWHSYDIIADSVPVSSVQEALDSLFLELEMRFGEVFVQHALGYLTCGKGGISSVEMEDVLSCDDHVLNYVYKYHDPPLEGVIRIPSLMWSRLQHALNEYLVERQVNNKTVYGWYHRQFWEAAERCYMKSDEQYKLLHSNLADIFLQDNGIKKTVTLHNRRGKVILNADRCVTHQPLTPANTRKLCSMTHHLLLSMRLEELQGCCLLNFEWLFVKLLSCSSYEVLQEYTNVRRFLKQNIPGQVAFEHAADRNLLIMHEFMQLCVNILKQDPLLLAYQISERLAPFKDDNPIFAKIYQDALKWMESASYPLLIPTHRLVLQEPDSPLRLKAFAGTKGILSSNKKIAVCRQPDSTYSPHCTINIFDIETAEVLVSTTAYNVTFFCLSHDDKTFIYVEKDQIKAREVASCDLIAEIKYESDYDRFTIRCLAISQDDQYVALGVKLGFPKKDRRCPSGGMLYLIHLNSATVVAKYEMSGKNILDRIKFIKGGELIFVSTRSKLSLFEGQMLNLVSEHQLQDMKLFYLTITVLSDDQSIMAAVGTFTEVKVLMFDTSSDTLTLSQAVNVQTTQAVRPFGLVTRGMGEQLVVGTYTKDTIPCSSVGLWNRETDSYLLIPLSARGDTKPTSLAVLDSWQQACVGWGKADVTIIDLVSAGQIMEFRVQGQGVADLILLNNMDHILTFSFDSTINVWDVAEILRRRTSQMSTNFRVQHEKAGVRMEEKCGKHELGVISSPAREVVCQSSDLLVSTTSAAAFTVMDRLAFTLDKDPTKSPNIWNMQDGTLKAGLTDAVQDAYTKSGVEAWGESEKSMVFGKVMSLGEGLIIYLRYGRIGLSTTIFNTNEPPSLLGQVKHLDAYAQLIIKTKTDHSHEALLKQFVVRDGILEIYTLPGLHHDGSIPIPKMSVDIPNPNTNNGVRKITALKIAVTTDGRYLVMHNCAIPFENGTKRPIDIVDLKQGTFVQRYLVPKNISGKVIGDGLCYLVLDQTGPFLYNASDMLQLASGHKGCYKCSLDVGKYISEDRTLGLGKDSKGHQVYLWQMEPLQLLHTLSGHTSEVTGFVISNDSRFVLTGSGDKMVRLYSTSNGHVLCSFHLDYPVDNVELSPSADYIGVFCFSERQFKRLVILKLHVDGREKRPALTKHRSTLNSLMNK